MSDILPDAPRPEWKQRIDLLLELALDYAKAETDADALQLLMDMVGLAAHFRFDESERKRETSDETQSSYWLEEWSGDARVVFTRLWDLAHSVLRHTDGKDLQLFRDEIWLGAESRGLRQAAQKYAGRV